ncbi:MAG: phosphopantothenate/pantothenate synthetase [Thaumarchaeota archaeon]|nr:phosphopantothenate/pantothenate synthetase [Nitrososphaerota archaeon]
MLTSANIPDNHPRAKSLLERERLVEGFRKGLVVPEGLIAYGRGEAFDYIIGGRTEGFAQKAIRAAAAALLMAKKPVISVNGNVAALLPEKVVELAKTVGAAIEVNLFYRTAERESAIAEVLKESGAAEVLGVGKNASARIPELMSERRKVDPRGILVADVVFVPLEDGDRTEALRKMGKTVIALDLNPMSRTSIAASITIVDNVVRAIPLLVEEAKKLRHSGNLRNIVDFDNEKNLQEAMIHVARRLENV